MDEEHEAFTFDIGVAAAGDLDDPWEALPPVAAAAEENGRGWEVVPVGDASSYGDDDLYVFPPNLHEGLHLQNEPTPTPTSALNLLEDQGPAAVESPAPRSEEEREAPERWRKMLGTARSLIGTRLDFVYSRIPSCQGGGSGCCCCCCTRMTVWSFAMLAGMAGVLLYMSRRHRRKKAVLLLLLQQKDQKISQLLCQIAQMNQIIAARQRVSVFRRI